MARVPAIFGYKYQNSMRLASIILVFLCPLCFLSSDTGLPEKVGRLVQELLQANEEQDRREELHRRVILSLLRINVISRC